jgi:hypothetical protein
VKTRLLPIRVAESGAFAFNAAWSESRVTPSRFAVSPVEYIRMVVSLIFQCRNVHGVQKLENLYTMPMSKQKHPEA